MVCEILMGKQKEPFKKVVEDAVHFCRDCSLKGLQIIPDGDEGLAKMIEGAFVEKAGQGFEVIYDKREHIDGYYSVNLPELEIIDIPYQQAQK